MSWIDGVVLDGYDLPRRHERLLLRLFEGAIRPGPIDTQAFPPPGFMPLVSLREYSTGIVQRASAQATLDRLQPIRDSSIHAALSELNSPPEA